jgi:hypothetical protein
LEGSSDLHQRRVIHPPYERTHGSKAICDSDMQRHKQIAGPTIFGKMKSTGHR